MFGLPSLFGLKAVLYTALVASAVGAAGGWYVAGKFEDAAKLDAERAARAKEQHQAAEWNKLELDYLARMARIREENEDALRDYRARLARRPGCPVAVPPEWVRPSDVPAYTAPAGEPGATAEGVDTVADARVVAATCERNRLETHRPNAEQIRALQRAYEDLRKRYNP